MNYFTAQIKTLKEEDYIKRLQDLLLFRAEKQRFIFPKKLMPVRRKGKEIKEMMPLFPGYIFIETEEIDTEQMSFGNSNQPEEQIVIETQLARFALSTKGENFRQIYLSKYNYW